MKRIILITGGQRTGKSMYAEQLALQLSSHPVYLATAHVWDEEFRQRIVNHQKRRGDQWTTVEEEKSLSHHDFTHRVVVVDCITLWCTNFFYEYHQQPTAFSVDLALQAIKNEFDLLTKQDAVFIFVTNEIGSGGVSESLIQRQFTDMQGWFNQYVASKADEVVMMVCGIPIQIK